MNVILQHKTTIIGMVAGATMGYAYYYFIGCSSGSCPITSDPLISCAYGGLMGALLFTNTKKN
jgi:hypothetical protein